MIIFETRVTVPAHIVNQIGNAIKDSVLNELVGKLETDQMFLLEDVMNRAIEYHANKEAKTCDGWSLEKKQALDIAAWIKQGKKINAIREFRISTGAGLRDAKGVLDQFEMNNTGAIQFLDTFV